MLFELYTLWMVGAITAAIIGVLTLICAEATYLQTKQ